MPRTIRKRQQQRSISRKVVNSLGKGLNNFVSQNIIDDAEASDLDNIVFVENGSPSKRPGAQEVGDALTAAKGLGTFNTAAGTNYLVTVDNGVLKYRTTGSWTSDNTVTFNTSAEIDFTQINDNLYIFDGVSGMGKLDSSLTLSRPTTTVKASFGIFYQGYHFVSGVAGQDSRVYMAVLVDVESGQDGDDFTDSADDADSHPGASAFSGSGAQYFDVQPNDGDVVTGFGKFSDVLIIFKRKSIHQLTLDASGVPTITPISNFIGCVNHKSIENVENDLFFMSTDGIYVLGNEPNFFETIRTNELSARVGPTLDTVTTSAYNKMSGIYFNNRYHIGLPIGGSTVQNTLMYDRRYLAWSVWDFVAPNSFTVYTDADSEEHLYYLDDGGTQVYELVEGTYNDGGTAINGTWTSKSFDFRDWDVEKRFVYLDLHLRSLTGSLDISVFTDGDELTKTTSIAATGSSGLGVDIIGTQVIGTSGGTVSADTTTNVAYRVRVNKNARTIKVKISNNNTNENFVLLGLAIGYYPFSSFKFDSARKLQ